MNLRFEGAALRRVGEDLGGETFAFRRVWNQIMHDVIGVNRLDAEVVQEARKEGLAAGNPSRETDFRLSVHSALGAGLTSASSVARS